MRTLSIITNRIRILLQVNLTKRRHRMATRNVETRTTAVSAKTQTDELVRKIATTRQSDQDQQASALRMPSLPQSDDKQSEINPIGTARAPSPSAGLMGEMAGELSRQPDWIKGIRGIQTFQSKYKPGNLKKSSVMWNPRVWEEEQEQKKKKAEEEKQRAEVTKRGTQQKLQLRKVRFCLC